ncbi:redoxin domain-containing protein [bacterium]|nr:redoxin domain-containing protein [bacterium]
MKLLALSWVLILGGMAGLGAGGENQIPLGTIRSIDLAGKVVSLGQKEGVKAIAIVFLSDECPISNQYIPELNRIAGKLADQPVEIYGVMSDRTRTRAQAKDFVKSFQVAMPVLFDASATLARLLLPTHVPEAFVLDPLGKVLYRGRIDNQFDEKLRRRTEVTTHDWADAIDAAVKGEKISATQTNPIGCKLSARVHEVSPSSITYDRDVAPILFANCAECHRAGEVAPFELLSYDDAAKRAEFIAEMTSSQKMPPWKARPDFGHFMGERILNELDRQVLVDWAKNGAKEGSSEDLPPAPSFSTGWQLGEPDLVIKMPEPYPVYASGNDINRFFVIPIDIPEDKYVVGVEFRPGNPRVVHHAILYLDRSGNARKRDEAEPGPGFEGFVATEVRGGGVLGFWAPGYTPRFYPQGVGQKLFTKTDLALQIHYHPSGKEEIDQSQVGIHFADKPVEKTVGGLALINFDVNIPAGESRHKMTHSFTTPVDLEIIDVTPHMHVIGTEMKATATLPDGSVIPLIHSNWDFNWQDVYRFRDVIHLPKGTRLDLEAYFDNSDKNPFNPNSPPAFVGFGEQTTDEMCICAFRLLEDPSKNDRQSLGLALRENMQQQMKNPRVMLAVTRFMMTGKGAAKNEGSSTGKSTE